jgi:hypothetical protein
LKLSDQIFYTLLDNKLKKFVRFNYKIGKMFQDKGIILNSVTNYSLIGLDYYETEMVWSEDLQDGIFLSAFLYINRKIEIFNINYRKIQEALAFIGGFMSLITLILKKISSILNRFERNLDIINEIFDFSEFKDEEKFTKIIEDFIKMSEKPEVIKWKPKQSKKDLFIKVSKVNNRINTLSKINQDDCKTDQINTDDLNSKVIMRFDKDRIIDELKKYDKENVEQYKLQISLWMKLKHYFCPNKLNLKEKFLITTYEKAINFVKSYFDAINYLKLQTDQFHIKTNVFSDFENLCLHFSNKPKLHESSKFINHENKTILNKLEGEIEIIKHFTDQKKLTDSDRNLLKLLSPKYKIIVENLFKSTQF